MDEILAAGLSEADLRELGLVQMKSRKKILQLLAQLAQQPKSPSVYDALLPRRDDYGNDSESSWSDDRVPENASELDAEHPVVPHSTDTRNTETVTDFGEARWIEHRFVGILCLSAAFSLFFIFLAVTGAEIGVRTLQLSSFCLSRFSSNFSKSGLQH